MPFTGTTIAGDGRGKSLGFPTINIEFPVGASRRFALTGVFAVRGTLGEKKIHGVAHFGPRPTFGKSETSFELHLFDFDEEVAENTMVEFEIIGEKIRDIQKFNSVEELKKQIAEDCDIARNILNP